jgi:Protein of unknown function (DUF3800)
MTPSSRYRLFIDESGDHTFNLMERDEHRYLALVGVWFEMEQSYKSFEQGLVELKGEVFGWAPGQTPLPLHRYDLVQRRGAFGALRDEQRNRLFEARLLELVANADFQIACATIDKSSHASKTYRRLYHPYHYCLAVLLERYTGWLTRSNGLGDVLVESRGKTEDRELKSAFGATVQHGTRFRGPAQFQAVLTSKDVKLRKKSADIAGLQLADLLAYPLRREMIHTSRRSAPPADFSSRLLDAVEPKLHRHTASGRIERYGKTWLD